jgi:probable rRNA maturation factor
MIRVLLDVSKGGRGAVAHGRRLSSLANYFGATLGLGDAELSLTLVEDRHIRRLKKQWLGVDAATDVLSFPAGDFPGPGPRPLGDIVISVQTARRVARQLGTSVRQELALYLAHGLLHLLGYDHQSPATAREMGRLERRLLGHAGMLARSGEA